MNKNLAKVVVATSLAVTFFGSTVSAAPVQTPQGIVQTWAGSPSTARTIQVTDTGGNLITYGLPELKWSQYHDISNQTEVDQVMTNQEYAYYEGKAEAAAMTYLEAFVANDPNVFFSVFPACPEDYNNTYKTQIEYGDFSIYRSLMYNTFGAPAGDFKYVDTYIGGNAVDGGIGLTLLMHDSKWGYFYIDSVVDTETKNGCHKGFISGILVYPYE